MAQSHGAVTVQAGGSEAPGRLRVKMPRMAKRSYSREFTPRSRKPEDRRTIMVDWVPPALYQSVKSKAKRDGVSLRTLILRLLSEWVKGSQ
jgi:hypothetical protein